MKRLLVGGLLWAFAAMGAMAADAPPLQATLSNSKDVLLAKVDSVKVGDYFSTATFSIKEALKGKTHGPLVLKTQFDGFKAGQEYILCRVDGASAKGTVAPTSLDGVPEWYCWVVTSAGDKITVDGIGSLEKVKEICTAKSP